MGPAAYIIAIMGCADGGSACTTVATLPARFESRPACMAATTPALQGADKFDFPTIVAECQVASSKRLSSNDVRRVTGSGRSGQ